MRSASDSPSSSSIAMYGVSSASDPTSNTRTTFGWVRRLTARASRQNRATAPSSRAVSGCTSFSAMRFCVGRCVAASTMPIPPSPTRRSIR